VPESGEWVGSGEFKIDREAALAKLAQYQLADPTLFTLAWVRAASAAGASAVRIDSTRALLRFEAHGMTFSSAELGALYDPLLDGGETPRAASRRHFAMGLLAAQQLDPAKIVIRSGRAQVTLDRAGSGAVDPADQEPGRTSVEIHADDRTRGADLARAAGWPALECPAAPMRIHVGEIEAPRVSAEADWLARKENGVRVWVRPALERLTGDRVAFSCLGARVATIELDGGLAGVDGLVDDPGLRLDLSQKGLVRDGRFDAAVNVLRNAAGVLIEEIAERCLFGDALRSASSDYDRWRSAQSNVAPAMTYRRPPWLAPDGRLRRWIELARDAAGELLARQSTSHRSGYLLARRIAWLRAACRNLDSPIDDRGRPGAASLWKAPIFLTQSGNGVSLERLESTRVETGSVFVERRSPGGIYRPIANTSRACMSLKALTRLLQSDLGDNLSERYFSKPPKGT